MYFIRDIVNVIPELLDFRELFSGWGQQNHTTVSVSPTPKWAEVQIFESNLRCHEILQIDINLDLMKLCAEPVETPRGNTGNACNVNKHSHKVILYSFMQ